MIDPAKAASVEKFRPFEGMWLATKPSGALICAKIINNTLLMPYSFGGEGKLTGHYFGCRVVEKTVFCHFEHFDRASSGVLFLAMAPNETLKGGCWMGSQVPEAVKNNISQLSGSLPGMQPVVWVRIRESKIPEWAEKYFREDWPNKHSS